MIQRIRIENLRGEKNAELTLEQVTVVCGRPASGKSLPLVALRSVAELGGSVKRALSAAEAHWAGGPKTKEDEPERRITIEGRFPGARNGRPRRWQYEVQWNPARQERLWYEHLTIHGSPSDGSSSESPTGPVAKTRTLNGEGWTSVYDVNLDEVARVRTDGKVSILRKVDGPAQLRDAARQAAPEYAELQRQLSNVSIREVPEVPWDVGPALDALANKDRTAWERVTQRIWRDQEVRQGNGTGPIIQAKNGAEYTLRTESSSRLRLAGIAAASETRKDHEVLYLLDHPEHAAANKDVAELLKRCAGTESPTQILVETDDTDLAARILAADGSEESNSWRIAMTQTPWT